MCTTHDALWRHDYYVRPAADKTARNYEKFMEYLRARYYCNYCYKMRVYSFSKFVFCCVVGSFVVWKLICRFYRYTYCCNNWKINVFWDSFFNMENKITNNQQGYISLEKNHDYTEFFTNIIRVKKICFKFFSNLVIKFEANDWKSSLIFEKNFG